MPEPFIGEIRLFAGKYAPEDWAFCDGTPLPIDGNETLFTLLGTTYGGDGINNFNLPDLRGRVPIHQGSGYVLGQKAGSEQVTLNVNNLPPHTHPVVCATASSSDTPAGNVWAPAVNAQPYGQAPGTVNMNPTSVSVTGGSLPHDNMSPYLVTTYIISLQGEFPSQS